MSGWPQCVKHSRQGKNTRKGLELGESSAGTSGNTGSLVRLAGVLTVEGGET